MRRLLFEITYNHYLLRTYSFEKNCPCTHHHHLVKRDTQIRVIQQIQKRAPMKNTEYKHHNSAAITTVAWYCNCGEVKVVTDQIFQNMANHLSSKSVTQEAVIAHQIRE